MAEEIDESALDAGRKQNIENRDSEVDRALSQSNFAGALYKALENPPLGTKSPEIKVGLVVKRRPPPSSSSAAAAGAPAACSCCLLLLLGLLRVCWLWCAVVRADHAR